MSHNQVPGTPADESGVLADGMKAGAEENYVKPGEARHRAHQAHR